MSQDPVSSAADFEWCHDILGDVSRTFALSIPRYEDPMQDELCVGYLLCRVADTIEDARHVPPGEKKRLLDQYREALDPESEVTASDFTARARRHVPEDSDDEWRLVARTPRLLATFESLPASSKREIRPRVEEMIRGMALFVDRYEEQGGLRIQTLDELEEYCWYVAGTVGELITGLITRDVHSDLESRLMETAPSFGLLLQLVNVTKDIATDYEEEDNVYVPEALLAKHDLDQEDIGDASQSDAFVPVVRELANEAEQHIDDARAWLDATPERRGNTLVACALPFLLAVGTLRELKSRPADVIRKGDVKVSRSEVFAVIAAFSGDEKPSLETLQAEIQAGPYSG
ncbi:MAG: phytoene/squalene synthase family protein [Salinirussus sp.]